MSDDLAQHLAAMWEVRPYVIDSVKQGYPPTPSMYRFDALLRDGLDIYTPDWAHGGDVSSLLLTRPEDDNG